MIHLWSKFDEFNPSVFKKLHLVDFKSFDTKVFTGIKNFFTLGKGGGCLVLYHYLMTLQS